MNSSLMASGAHLLPAVVVGGRTGSQDAKNHDSPKKEDLLKRQPCRVETEQFLIEMVVVSAGKIKEKE